MKAFILLVFFLSTAGCINAQSLRKKIKEVKRVNRMLDKTKKEGEKGNVDAMLKIAVLYTTGIYEGEDYRDWINYEHALTWYRMADAKGSLAGTLGIAEYYNRQRMFDVKYDSTFFYFRKAIAAGYVPAMIKLGALYQKGLVTYGGWSHSDSPLPPKTDSAIFYYTKAAALGADSMYYYIGNIYLFSATADMRRQALPWFKKAADKGYAPAIAIVEDYATANNLPYEKGLAAQQAGRDTAAFALFKIASEINYDPRAMVKLAHYYNKDRVDEETALYWYQKASALGSAEASNLAGWTYYVRREFTNSYDAFTKAIEQGYTAASYGRDLAQKGYTEKAADQARAERKLQEQRNAATANAPIGNTNATSTKTITVKWCYECDGSGKIYNVFNGKKLSTWHTCGACNGKGYTN